MMQIYILCVDSGDGYEVMCAYQSQSDATTACNELLAVHKREMVPALMDCDGFSFEKATRYFESNFSNHYFVKPIMVQ